jgi:hypothetical protein
VCNRVFPAADRLIAHSSEHTGIKAHTCTVCKRAFSRIDRMRAHYRTSHPELASSSELHIIQPLVSESRMRQVQHPVV